MIRIIGPRKMGQVSKYPISKNIADRIFEIFLTTFVRIRDEQEADQFVSDLLTPTEKIMLAKRLAIAFLLAKDYDYRAIKYILKVSSGTISSVNLAIQHGSEGYKKVIEKILREESLIKLLDNAVIKFLSAPAALEKGKGTWSYLKRQSEEKKKRNKKPF